jgi:hypothetical protein
VSRRNEVTYEVYAMRRGSLGCKKLKSRERRCFVVHGTRQGEGDWGRKGRAAPRKVHAEKVGARINMGQGSARAFSRKAENGKFLPRARVFSLSPPRRGVSPSSPRFTVN